MGQAEGRFGERAARAAGELRGGAGGDAPASGTTPLRPRTALPAAGEGPPVPGCSSSPCVLCLVRPDADDFFGDVRAAGHPESLQALRLAGAAVRVVRASCLCQGRRLAQDGEAVELVRECSVLFRAPAPRAGAAELARGLSHLRCWAEALGSGGAVVVLEASARLAPGRRWSQVLSEAAAAASRGDEVLLLSTGATPTASAYALTVAACARLAAWRSLLPQCVRGADELVAALAGRPPAAPGAWLGGMAALRSTAVPLFEAGLPTGTPGLAPPPQPPPPRRCPGRRGVKVFIITLPHRADRRVEPLVGSSAAVAAMRDEGFDVEILRASCYCERDRLNERGSVSCHAGGLQPIRMRRYEGASVPLGKEESAQMRQFIDDNYLEGADRLIMEGAGREGTVEGYIVDSNWPGATGCAMSHIRAMVEAALAGFEFALVFEDDAVVPADVARARGWCTTCTGALCHCASSWACAVQEAAELMRRVPSMDVLYLGVGERFEEAGETDGLLRPKPGGCMRFFMGGGSDSDSEEEDLGGVTELGYTWHAQALMYSRAALDDVLRLRLWEQIWAHDETIPHLYGRRPWNHRYVDALRKAGWERRWIAGAPTDFLEDEGWVLQLESFTLDDDGNPLPTGDLGLGSAWKSSNSAEF